MLDHMTGKTERSVQRKCVAIVWAATLFALFLPVPFAVGDPLEERVACWESYEVCVLGAGNAEQWRSVCYSDYSSCMKSPGYIQCRPEDQSTCSTKQRECTDRGDGSKTITSHCKQDHQVCLDAFSC